VRCSIPFAFFESIAFEFGAVECSWRESSRSFSGFVAEVWFESLPQAGQFARRAAGAVGFPVSVRCPSEVPGFFVSVPCSVREGAVRLGPASRGSRVQLSD
jgi:hypothetical protein